MTEGVFMMSEAWVVLNKKSPNLFDAFLADFEISIVHSSSSNDHIWQLEAVRGISLMYVATSWRKLAT